MQTHPKTAACQSSGNMSSVARGNDDAGLIQKAATAMACMATKNMALAVQNSPLSGMAAAAAAGACACLCAVMVEDERLRMNLVTRL